jgi:signal transduction histidine kinase
MNQRIDDIRTRLRGLLHFSPQNTILLIAAVVLLVVILILARIVVAQGQASDTLLNYNYYDEQRVTFQLDHELLKLLIVLAQPVEAFDPAAAQSQIDLVDSRLAVLYLPDVMSGLPDALQENIVQIENGWVAVKPDLQKWISQPANPDLLKHVRQTVRDIELLVTTTEIRYQQTRSISVIEFVRTNQQLLLAFGGSALMLFIFVTIVAVIFYRFARQSQEAEAAREANRLKDQFLAVMSHELRTPLNAIIGFLGLMKMNGKLDDRAQHMVERARANAERLLSLVNDILDISKIESGKFELVPAPVSLRDITQRWQLQMDVLAKQKGLEFSVQIDDNLPDTIFIDEDALTKVTTNLLSNAFKFTQKGSVTLNMKRSAPDEWQIRVTDTGMGIPDSARQLIFESFRQVDGSIRRSHGGTGLGLSIVQRLCTSMKGTVQVESVLGQGSTFIIQLPLEMPPDSAKQPDLKPRPEQTAPTWSG